MNKISDLKLEQWLLGELSTEEAARIQSEVEKDEQLRSRIDAINLQSQELLAQHPPQQFAAELKRKMHLLNTQEAYREKQPRISPMKWRILAGVLAVGVALFVVLPSFSGDPEKGQNRRPAPYRSKGETIHLMAHLVVENQQQQLFDQGLVRAGDRIQLSIKKAKGLSFFVFSIDGHGVISTHYPREQASKIEESDFFSLPASYRLDNAPNFENFYLVSAQEILDKEDILKKIKEAQKNTDFQTNFRALIPAKFTINQISLKKEKP